MGANSIESFANLGNAKFRMENYKDASSNYDKVIAAGKADAVIYNNRGKAKFNLQDYKGALPDFDKSLELKPGNDKAIENRAETRYQLQDWKGSIADFEKLIATGRSDVEFYQKVGFAKYTLEGL